MNGILIGMAISSNHSSYKTENIPGTSGRCKIFADCFKRNEKSSFQHNLRNLFLSFFGSTATDLSDDLRQVKITKNCFVAELLNLSGTKTISCRF